jgi:hypothetical protein
MAWALTPGSVNKPRSISQSQDSLLFPLARDGAQAQGFLLLGELPRLMPPSVGVRGSGVKLRQIYYKSLVIDLVWDWRQAEAILTQTQ